MVPKIKFTIFFRLLLVLSIVVVAFSVLSACSEKSTSAPLTLSDVYASDISVVYDGRPHSVTVNNTLLTDTVLFSTDNVSFSASSPLFVLPNTYTVYFKVIRSGYEVFSSSAVVTISPSVLDGISAPDVSFVYDGLFHSVSVIGALSSDTVTYSTDGISFSTEIPSFSDVGAYTVYYRVQRIYGEYRSSCSLTILPNIFGRYFNPSFGIISLSSDKAYINSIEADISFSPDGSGYIASVPFSVSNNSLIYNSLSFTLMSDSDHVYKLCCADNYVYFCSSVSGVLSVSFNDDVGIVKLEGDVLLSVPNVNYCESGVISDYVDLSFTQAFYASSDVTEIDVSFSMRPDNPLTVDYFYFVHDGLPHGFDFAVPAVFPDGEPEFTEVGCYTVSVLFLSDEFLPLFLDCTVVILPCLDGVYFSRSRVFEFDGDSVYIDGAYCGELSTLNGDRAYDGRAITVTDDGIVYDGVLYIAAERVTVVCIDGVVHDRAVIPPDVSQIYIRFDGSTLSCSYTDSDFISIPLSAASVAISCNGEPLTPIPSEPYVTFVLGTSDIFYSVVLVLVSTFL